MSSQKKPSVSETTEGIDREIAILRNLIRKAAAKQSTDLSFEEQLDLLDTVGKTAPALARLLKARRDLANQELNPAALLPPGTYSPTGHRHPLISLSRYQHRPSKQQIKGWSVSVIGTERTCSLAACTHTSITTCPHRTMIADGLRLHKAPRTLRHITFIHSRVW